MIEKKTGRPPKYTEAQVIEGIEIVERSGEAPTGDTVKKAMCSQLGVAGGINAQSLEKEVERLLDERDRQRRARLISALPSATRGAAKEIGSLVETAVLEHIGEQHDSLRALTGKKVAELNVDLGTQREQIRGLLGRIDTKDAEIAGLEGERDDLEGRLDLAAAEIDSLKERIVGLEREEDFQARMLALMKEALGKQADATGGPIAQEDCVLKAD
ncbi:hypothetical protein [Roseovarius nanhaiticus]|uniref:hypothetical protein n=1 Tax=Roseovarius nanhaiticus TaxID=573024 RepID=UPI00249206C2|nr:hypothetical protein [Roseovarius nanhaiticus]